MYVELSRDPTRLGRRYFGKSTPFGEAQSKKRLEFCTIDQALADYAELIVALKNELVCCHRVPRYLGL
jgi:hypothetical protein